MQVRVCLAYVTNVLAGHVVWTKIVRTVRVLSHHSPHKRASSVDGLLLPSNVYPGSRGIGPRLRPRRLQSSSMLSVLRASHFDGCSKQTVVPLTLRRVSPLACIDLVAEFPWRQKKNDRVVPDQDQNSRQTTLEGFARFRN